MEAVSQYYIHSYAQLGANYPLSDKATTTVDKARSFIKTVYFNGYAE